MALLTLQHEYGFILRAYALQKTLGYSPWASLWSHPKSGVPWPNAFDVNMPQE